MTETPETGDEITTEARLMAARVRQMAGAGPTAEELARITADALRRQREDMTPADIRRLATDALVQSQRVSYLLGKLAGLLNEETP